MLRMIQLSFLSLEVKSHKVLFLIIGEGDQKHLVEEIKKLRITNLIMLPYQPVDMIPYSLHPRI